MSQPKPTIAFFGSTGGCTLVSLIHSLRAGHPCVALVRTPSKLLSLLSAADLDSSTLDTLLTVHEGNALDVEAVKKTLLSTSNMLPRTIITGLGGAPQLARWNIWDPFNFITLDNPTICASAASTLLSALSSIYTSHPSLTTSKPKLVFISTTGITSGPEDVPFVLRFLYHRVLAVPHVDKLNMEGLYSGEEGKRLLASVTGIRPTLLMGTTEVGDGVGWEKIRAGREAEPVLGYTVKRADVGGWIFGNLIADGEGKWEGEMVSLTN